MNEDSIPMRARAEVPTDQSAIWHVNAEAFQRRAEADLVDALRDNGDLVASSVVEVNGRIVGHAALSIGSLGRIRVLVLAPVAVIPDFQGQGVGQAVVNHVLEKADDITVTVLGDPDYYRKFGFEAAEPFGVTAPFPVEPGALQLLRPEGVAAGTVMYAAPFLDL